MEILLEKLFLNSKASFYFLCIIGFYALSCWCFENFKSIFRIFISILTPYFLPHENKSLVERYGKWSVITGCTDGIGLEYAKQLAKQGVNIALISRTELKLKAVAKEIESTYGVKTKTIAVDFGAGSEIYDVIREQLQHLDIGILVNNVGRMYECPDNLDNVSEELIWQIIHINIGAVTMMSRMIIPKMKQNRRGIIVNVSSGTEAQPLPLSIVYASSKIYIKNFSLALTKELEEFNVEVQLLTPMFVRTKMNNYSTSVMKGNLLVPDVASYAKWAVFTLGKTPQTTGYFMHGIQYGVTKLVPESFRTFIGYRLNKMFRDEFYAQQN